MFLKSEVCSTLFCLISSVTPQPGLRSHSLNKVLRALQSGPLTPYCHILSLLLLRLYCSHMKHLPGRSKCQDCSPVQDFTPVFSIGANLFSHLVTLYLPFSLWGNGPSLSTVYSWHLAQCVRHSEHSKCRSYKFIKIKLAYAFKFYFHKDVNLSVCVPTISECTPCMNACL